MTATQFANWLREKRHRLIIVHPDDFWDIWQRVVPAQRGRDTDGSYIQWGPQKIRTIEAPYSDEPLDVSAQRIFEEDRQ